MQQAEAMTGVIGEVASGAEVVEDGPATAIEAGTPSERAF